MVNVVVHHFYDVTTVSRVYRGWLKRQKRLRVPNKMAGERARQAPQALEDLLFDGAIGKNGLKAAGRITRLSEEPFLGILSAVMFLFLCCSSF